jgi:quinol monooxygenase YgiN
MTEQLTVVAHLRALNGQIEETKKFLMGLVAPTRAEPGCVE